MVEVINNKQDNQVSPSVNEAKATKLYNRLTRSDAISKLMAEDFKRVTVSFYRYFTISNPKDFRDNMYSNFEKLGVLGRIYIANEGINAQLSLPEANLASFRLYLDSIAGFDNLRLNMACEDDGKSFAILKVKVRKKIVADGITDESFDASNSGKYVNAKEFNELTSKPETIVVDMRNHYEYEVGHFANALEIPSETFREQLNRAVAMLSLQKDKDIVMYCTGGIRCEKASAWLKHKGFDKVYHLEGGIINYANNVKKLRLENKFHGKNFVFDERFGERISEEVIAKCHQCGKVSDTHVNCANSGCHLLFIQCEECAKKYHSCCSARCQEIIQLPEEEQAKLRKIVGQQPQKIFNKAKDVKLNLGSNKS